jgi:hypothetical protein
LRLSFGGGVGNEPLHAPQEEEEGAGREAVPQEAGLLRDVVIRRIPLVGRCETGKRIRMSRCTRRKQRRRAVQKFYGRLGAKTWDLLRHMLECAKQQDAEDIQYLPGPDPWLVPSPLWSEAKDLPPCA